MMKGLENKSNEKWLMKLALNSLEKRRLSCLTNLIAFYNDMTG